MDKTVSYLKAGILLLSFVTQSSWAFHLQDHQVITQVAWADLVRCQPALAARLNLRQQDLILKANLEEDLNLARKWSRYSHYYNPFKKLDMRREDSSVSISESQAELLARASEGFSDRNLGLLGRMAHHLQDTAVPSHVVPVIHGFRDGFEDFSIGTLASQADCSWVTPDAGDGLALLKASAMTTYERLQELVRFQQGEKSRQDTWACVYWTPSLDNGFGAYGKFGNRFGVTSFREQSDEIRIEPDTFLWFKKGQMQQAVEVTRLMYLWAYRVIGSPHS